MSKTAFPHLSFAARSEPGLKRKNNEDSFGVFPQIGVWCVADGMGGGDDGEIASAEVIQKVDEFRKATPFPAGACRSGEEVAAGVADAVNVASDWIFARAEKKGLKGCGSTFVAAVFDASHPNRVIALHAGDSRLYRIRGRDIKQITKDHSAAELVGAKSDADLNPMFRGMILRAVGIQRTVEIEKTAFEVRKDDIVLICSDGLSKMVPDKKIASMVNKSGGSVKAAVDALIEAAYKAGATDNVTVEVVKVGELPPPVMAVAPETDEEGENGPNTTNTSDGEAATFDDHPGDNSDETMTVGTAIGTGVFEVASDDTPSTASRSSGRKLPLFDGGKAPSHQPLIWLFIGIALGAIAIAAVFAVVAVVALRRSHQPPPQQPPTTAETTKTAETTNTTEATKTTETKEPTGPKETKETKETPAPAETAEPKETPAPPVSLATTATASVVAVSTALPPEKHENESLAEQLKSIREQMRQGEVAAAEKADEAHKAAIALGDACRQAQLLLQFTSRIEEYGVSCASMRSCAKRLAGMKPDENGFDSAAGDLVRTMQKLAMSTNQAARAAMGRAGTKKFTGLDSTSAEAYRMAASAIESAGGREKGDG